MSFNNTVTTVHFIFVVDDAATPMAADDDDANDDDDYVDAYGLAPAASVFVPFQNRFLPYQLIP